MATEPARSADAELAQFRALADEWRAETSILSDPTAEFMHPAYQRIIGMGRPAFPLIFAELRDRSGHWFWALRAITGDDPVPQADAGNVRAMRRAWPVDTLNKGEEEGFAPAGPVTPHYTLNSTDGPYRRVSSRMEQGYTFCGAIGWFLAPNRNGMRVIGDRTTP